MHREKRPLASITICTDLPVPARYAWWRPFEIEIPRIALLPSDPGKLDYVLDAVAEIDGGKRSKHAIIVVAPRLDP